MPTWPRTSRSGRPKWWMTASMRATRHEPGSTRTGSARAPPRGASQRQYAWGLHDTLDVTAMQAAGDRLAGEHDFRAFGRSPRPGGHTIRHVHGVTVSGAGDWVTIAVAADAFLYGMVRRIARALVEVGRRRQPVEWIDSLLSGSTTGLRLAPPQGLVQVAVEY